MDNKPHERDLRSHFAAILGYEIEDIEDATSTLSYRTGVWSKELETGHVTSLEKSANGNTRTVCGESYLFSVGGQKRTGANGKADFLLSEYHCDTLQITPQLPIIFVATAVSELAVFVTTYNLLITPEGSFTDFRIRIYTWEPGGTPAKGITVNWLCQFPFTFNLL
jgi:hypothetical protein